MDNKEWTVHPIARIQTDFSDKFGIPRQSGRIQSLTGRIIFEPPYRDVSALRGIESFSHLWLLFDFSQSHCDTWSPTVRPPRLGGNTRVGVFASRSPFRPNPIGLSCVRLLGVEHMPQYGATLLVGGIDLLDGTPILDIKPYLPYADSITDASAGYTEDTWDHHLDVSFPPMLLEKIPADKRDALVACLRDDPRPSYQDLPDRVYGMHFAGKDIRFQVCNNHLMVLDITEG